MPSHLGYNIASPAFLWRLTLKYSCVSDAMINAYITKQATLICKTSCAESTLMQWSEHPFAFLLKEPKLRLASGPLSPVRGNIYQLLHYSYVPPETLSHSPRPRGTDNIQAFLFFSKSDKFIPTVCAQTGTFIQTPIDRATRASANARTGSGERKSGRPSPIRTPCAFTVR